MEKAQRLREEWQAKGNPPCEHKNTEKEHYLGSDTGDRVCSTCGATI
jgi:hypothetical protein